ncbi:MAG: hypothetical protein ACMUIS_11135 [bacterium]
MTRKLSIFKGLVFLLCTALILSSPVASQYSGFTISPPNPAVGYGGLYNPYVFFPGFGIRSSAINTPLSAIGPYGWGGFGFGNTLGTFSLAPFTSNPLFGFGGIGLGLPSTLGIFPQLTGGLRSGVIPPIALASSTLATAPLAAAVAPIRTAAQAGSWTGSWQSTYIAFPVLWNSGPMLLNLAEDPLLGILAGTAVMQGSRYASIPFEVSGVIINDTITLEGFLGTGYDCVLTGILLSPTTMTGFYTVLGTATPVMDEGIFNLNLNPPVL